MKVKELTPVELVARWPQVRFDHLTHIEQMTEDTLDLLNTMCKDAMVKNEWIFRINSSYREGNKKSQHYLGRAIDGYFFHTTRGDVLWQEQFAFAKQYPWGGIGFYPRWHTPGLHLDTRQGLDHIAYWWVDEKGIERSIAEAEELFGLKLV
jgi:uncharacterized protein YcbK (DUF882 family)